MREKRIRWNVFAQAVYTIALPIAFQNLLSTTASMVDTIMIGSMGELSVAAVGICSQISSLFFSCYFGFAGGALLFFSQYWGAKSEKGINKTFGLSMSFMLLVGLLFGAVAVTKPEFLLGIYTDKKNIIEVAIPYIRIVGFAYPLQVLAVIISFLMRATERVKIPLVSSAVALVVNSQNLHVSSQSAVFRLSVHISSFSALIPLNAKHIDYNMNASRKQDAIHNNRMFSECAFYCIANGACKP